MSAFAPKASFATLPPELLRDIFPDPSNIEGFSVTNSNPRYQHWLALKQTWTPVFYGEEASRQREEATRTLLALSQMCRSLRAYALPLLWSVLHVRTMSELGRLREVLRVSPSIARHVRSFCFMWNMEGDFYECEAYPDEEGTRLQMAFSDRWRIWETLRRQHGCEASWDFRYDDPVTDHMLRFELHGVSYDAPGRCQALIAGYSSGGWPILEPYSSELPKQRGIGPDGDGEDRLIKSANDFHDCIVEVVSQLSWLQTFGWDTSVTPMPAGVHGALSRLSTLTSLHLDMSIYRGNPHTLPLWTLVTQLSRLSFDFEWIWRPEDARGEESETTMGAFEIPAEIRSDSWAISSLRFSVVYRTIIAAARGGRLRWLHTGRDVQRVFAIRSLLPFWVGLEHGPNFMCGSSPKWRAAADAMRYMLAHASLRHESHRPASEDSDRLLTRQDIQALQSQFENGDIPHFVGSRFSQDPQEFDYYLSWLKNDGPLAQQVADAWNELVRGGMADKVKCRCQKCRSRS